MKKVKEILRKLGKYEEIELYEESWRYIKKVEEIWRNIRNVKKHKKYEERWRIWRKLKAGEKVEEIWRKLRNMKKVEESWRQVKKLRKIGKVEKFDWIAIWYKCIKLELRTLNATGEKSIEKFEAAGFSESRCWSLKTKNFERTRCLWLCKTVQIKLQ